MPKLSFHPNDTILKVALTVAFTFCSTLSLQAEAATWDIQKNRATISTKAAMPAAQTNASRLLDKTGAWIAETGQTVKSEWQSLEVSKTLKTARKNSHLTRSSLGNKISFSKKGGITSPPALIMIFAFLGIVLVLRNSNSEV